MNFSAVNVSFIIPLFNEEKTIGLTIDSIHEFISNYFKYEIIVIDNGSTDSSCDVVKQTTANLYLQPDLTIAGLRNFGVEQSVGGVLVFLDSDILLTNKWKRYFLETVEFLMSHQDTVTGSRVLPEDNKAWLNKYWFYPLTKHDASYINSGHLITTKSLFNAISGFDATLKTAEDYDFCVRALESGAQIKNDKKLEAIHLGYPKTIINFMKRERWHGRQDFVSMDSFKESKIAWLSALNILLLLFFVMLSVAINSYLVLLLYPFTMGVVSVLLTVYKFGLRPLSLLIGTSWLFYFYLCGRSMALLDRFFK